MSCESEHHHHAHLHVAPIPTNSAQSLLSKIDIPHVTALNVANPPDEVHKLFRTLEDKYKLQPVVKSDCDAQVVLNIPFLNASVKLFSLILRTNGDGYCPKKIRLFKNDTSIDFDNVESKKPTLVLENPQVGVMYSDDEVPEEIVDDGDFVEHYLPRHIFTGVQQLTLFIEDVWGDEDESHLHYIELRGEYTELTKDPVIALYELAANPADHKNMTEAETRNYLMN